MKAPLSNKIWERCISYSNVIKLATFPRDRQRKATNCYITAATSWLYVNSQTTWVQLFRSASIITHPLFL